MLFQPNSYYSSDKIATELMYRFYYKNMDSAIGSVNYWIRKLDIRPVNNQKSHRYFLGTDCQKVVDAIADQTKAKLSKGDLFMNTFQFLSPKGNRKVSSNADITITAYSNNDLAIIFRNGTKEKITPTTGRITVAVVGNILAFKEDIIGWKCSKQQNVKCDSYRTQITANTTELNPIYKWAKKYAGDYGLEYDEFNNLYIVRGREVS